MVHLSNCRHRYDTVQQSSNANGIAPPATWTVDDVERWLLAHAKAIMTDSGDHLSPYVDMFEHGFDRFVFTSCLTLIPLNFASSLSATYLRNRILGALRSSSDSAVQAAAKHVPQDFIFAHPSIRNLGSAVIRLIHPDGLSADASSNQGAAFVEQMIAKYSDNLPKFKRASQIPENEIVVLLTGTTGNLGSNILAALLADRRVKKIYALNRPSTKRDRQRLAFIEGGFPLEVLNSEALHLLEGDISRADLGLDHRTLSEVRDQPL